MSVLVAPCIIYVRGYCYPPLPAEEGRKGDCKTTTWVIVGGRTGTRDFLDTLPPFTSPSAGIISSVLDLSHSHARTHLNTFFLRNCRSWGHVCCAFLAVNDLLSAVKCSLVHRKSWTDVKASICDYWYNLSRFLKLATCKTLGALFEKNNPLWLFNFFVLGC